MARKDSDGDSKPKSKMKFILIGVVILAIAGGGVAGGWWYFGSAKPAAHAEAEAEEPPAEEHSSEEAEPEGEKPAGGHAQAGQDGILNFEPFLVNLADKDAFRYVRVTMRVKVTNKTKAEQIMS